MKSQTRWLRQRTRGRRSLGVSQNAAALMAGGPAVEIKGELSVCMPSGFPGDVEPPPQCPRSS